ncbi:hypothetical protein ABZW26_09460 [Streptomyces sp. NPDC004623]|uniref:hypothetical protein n=1 Tax=Streptomyces sp. NPDC004623 TaxID=3156653 RepID=UPI0033BB1599
MGTLKTARHRGAAVALLLPVIIGVAGCGTGEKAEVGKAVYGLPLAEQFQAATDATREDRRVRVDAHLRGRGW